MKLNIIFDDNVNLLTYRLILQETIINIYSKLGETFNDIRWVIFDSNNLQKSNIYNNLSNHSLISFIVSQGKDYGFCNLNKREIWISTKTLISYAPNDFITRKLITSYTKPNLLVDVILDELTHVKTGEDHGSKVYNDQLREYKNRYYANSIYNYRK